MYVCQLSEGESQFKVCTFSRPNDSLFCLLSSLFECCCSNKYLFRHFIHFSQKDSDWDGFSSTSMNTEVTGVINCKTVWLYNRNAVLSLTSFKVLRQPSTAEYFTFVSDAEDITSCQPSTESPEKTHTSVTFEIYSGETRDQKDWPVLVSRKPI